MGKRAVAVAVAMAVTMAAVSGCAGPSQGERRPPIRTTRNACEVLALEVPVERPSATRTVDSMGAEVHTVEGVLHASFVALDPDRSELTVYVEPGQDDHLGALAERLEQIPVVQRVRVVGVDETYEDFKRIFSDEPAMIQNVRPSDLPTRIAVTLDHGLLGGGALDPDLTDASGTLSPEEVAQQIRGWDDVRTVRAVHSFGGPNLTKLTARHEDRASWAAASAALRGIPRAKSWAATGADIIDAVLTDGGNWARAMKLGHDEAVSAEKAFDAAAARCH